MRRSVDLRCVNCEHEEQNVICEEEAILECPDCHAALEQIWWKRAAQHNAQWDDNTAVLVFINERTGEPRYPGRHDARMPPGYRRHYLRSLRDVDRFDREHKVVNEAMHFDRNGRGLDDNIQ